MIKAKFFKLIVSAAFYVVSFASQADGPIQVDVTIKPGGEPNSINPNSKGIIPVAILSSAVFDATSIEAESLRFGPAAAPPAHRYGGHYEDVNGDGLIDLLSHYRTQDTGIIFGMTEACVTGNTWDGRDIEGCDAIRIVPDSD